MSTIIKSKSKSSFLKLNTVIESVPNIPSLETDCVVSLRPCLSLSLGLEQGRATETQL